MNLINSSKKHPLSPLSVQYCCVWRLRFVIMLRELWFDKKLQQPADFATFYITAEEQKIWKGKSWTSTTTSFPRTGPTSKKGFWEFFLQKNCHIDCLVAGMDMGAGSVLTTPVEAAQSQEKPIWWRWCQPPSWEYSHLQNHGGFHLDRILTLPFYSTPLILSLFSSSKSKSWCFSSGSRMETSSARWRRTAGAQR